MEGFYFDGISVESLPMCHERHDNVVNNLSYDAELLDATSHFLMSLSPDLRGAGFSNSFMVYGGTAANGLDDVSKGFRYLTPNESTVQSPSMASEGVYPLFYDAHQSCRSIMSPDQGYGYNSPPARSSVRDLPGMEFTLATSSISPIENSVEISHNSQLSLVPWGSYEDLGQDIWSHFAQPPQYNLPATATEDLSIGMAYAESGRDSQVYWPSLYTQRTIEEEYGAQQGIFHESLDESVLYPAAYAAAHTSYNAAENLPHVPSPKAPTSISHFEHVAAVSPSSFPDGRGHGSCCKSCRKLPSAPNMAPKSGTSMTCQALYCLFAFAGCDCRCKGKNEWKRHLKTQHLLTRLFKCPHCPNKNFNRKDLFTQHYLRTHCTQAEQTGYKMKKTSPELDRMLQKKQAEAENDEMISPPEAPTCLFQGCEARFANDGTSWEKCLDHVSKHLEAMVAGKEAYRDYQFTNDQLAHFETLGAIARGNHGRWVLGAQSNGERARENKKKIGKRPADADSVEGPKVNKRRRKGDS